MRGQRFDRLDALRGAAIVWMAVFHLCFDLNLHGLIDPRQNFYRDPFWTGQRTAIVSLFLLCAGLSLASALQAGQSYDIARSFTVPADMPTEAYYVFVVTDPLRHGAVGEVFESDERNNDRPSSVPMVIENPPPSDVPPETTNACLA